MAKEASYMHSLSDFLDQVPLRTFPFTAVLGRPDIHPTRAEVSSAAPGCVPALVQQQVNSSSPTLETNRVVSA